ncbi:hypothetical protein CPB84DRAFT_1537540 [Gymnopilus junonius]|uniref:Uncharacterized protein n=1 Tax=Gymnopilus junonius TaxID=109634 RepID=A0A9P5NF28_GYMJU|nr:hypothetical protein CPB84DRAFT_1537540 [Gymnopilus junonius]
MYTYSTRLSQSSKHRTVIGSISLSYFFSAIQTSLQWYILKKSFIDNGGAQDTIVVTFMELPSWFDLVNDISFFVAGAIANGLLIWRCYQIWNGSFRAIMLPIFFVVCAIALYMAMIVITFVTQSYSSSTRGSHMLDILTGVLLFMDLAITLSTTVLISYRINSFAKRNPFPESRSRFKRIVEILVQSAAAYSIVIIVYAITTIIPIDTLESINAARSYISIFYFSTAGIAPTIMVI